ncbi:unnamed protein product, partial [Closterium sp. NIES-54]
GRAPSGVSQVDAVEPVEVAVDSGAARGVEPEGAGSGGAEPERAEPRGAKSGGAERGVAESGGAEPKGAEPARVESGGAAPGGPSGASSRREPLSPQQLREWFARRWSRAAGAGGATGAGGCTAAGAARSSGVTGPRGARTGGTGAAGPGGATGAGGAGAGGTAGAGAAGGTGAGATGAAEAFGGSAGAGGAAGAGAPGGAGVGTTGAAGGAARAGGAGADAGGAGAVPAGSGGAARPRLYFVPLLEQPTFPLPAPSPYTGPTGGLTEPREPESRLASPVCAACTSRRGSRQRPPPVPGTHQMALRPSTAPLHVPLPSPSASSLPSVADLLSDLARAASPTVTRLLTTGVTDPSFESTAASALVAELVGFAAHCRLDYAASLVAESESVCPPSVGGECALSTDVLEDRQEGFQYLGLQITRDRARRTITLTQSHMVQQVLQRFNFTYSSPQATPLSTRHSLSALSLDESVVPSGPYPELIGCLMYLMTCTRPHLAYPLSILARYVAPWRHRPEHMDAANRVLRYLCSTSGMGLVLGGRARVVLTGHADASWELRWLTYLLTDLGEAPRSSPVLYIDNKAMLALCQEHRLEHRTKHIALRYFLAQELQQRGQLRLAYVATRANTADIFTKALQPCNHQRFCTMLGLVPTWPHLLTS